MTLAAPLLALDAALARRLEQAEATTTARYTAAQALLDPASGSTASTIGDGLAFFAGAGSPINRVVGLGTAQPVSPALVAACEAFYAARGEACRIDLCPAAHPSLTVLLAERGYAAALSKHVFVLSLAEWDSAAAGGSTIAVSAITPDEAELWADTLAAAGDDGRLNLAARAIALPNPHKADTICFVARVGGLPAGGGALALVDGVAICYSTAVRPAMRRQGVQRALLDARLAYARDRGCNLALVQTTPGSASQRNVARCGFQLAYTKVTMMRPVPG
ncbi:MAG: GNAT family N-acetyltransferase [Caldilinea sp.]|nr:GNAT family N-acetyltransferase [Caldilinea sp.]MCB9115657.1 GNAT family N-acetyltransferase [Caldilineaceae bacterium]MCB9121143.1 GNAT family N-acetyltransferase [Caldilineaceae bacterium]MCB9123221.1 GNAT family N-acetyltransferase [Caldilineaceae bacterium]MCW5841945.1 GNAT family N-acetyltransferase [Caldilinea sp.]